MPLTALLDGTRMISTLCSEEDWERLIEASREDRSRLLMGCSGLPCYPRRSTLGLRHFVHRKGVKVSGVSEPESSEHLWAKALVVQAAAEAGWQAEAEVPADDGSWVADVMLTRGTRRVVIEIQCSWQSEYDYYYRQKRYEDAGIECLWLHHYDIDPWERTGYKVPLFKFGLDKKQAKMSIVVPALDECDQLAETTIDASEFVSALAGYRLVNISEERLYLSRMACFRCHVGFSYWVLTASPFAEIFVAKNPQRTLKVRRAVEQVYAAFITEKSKEVLAVPREAYTRTSNTIYTAFHCPHCGALQGDYFIMDGLKKFTFRIPTGVTSHLTERSIYLTPGIAQKLYDETMAIKPVVGLMKAGQW